MSPVTWQPGMECLAPAERLEVSDGIYRQVWRRAVVRKVTGERAEIAVSWNDGRVRRHTVYTSMLKEVPATPSVGTEQAEDEGRLNTVGTTSGDK